MFGPEYFTPVGYLTDCCFLCVECGDKEGLPISEQVMAAYFNNDYEGTYCDQCGAEINPPWEWTCPHCEKVYYGEDARQQDMQSYGHKCCDECPGEED